MEEDGLTTMEVLVFLLWSTLIMVFLAWTVIPSAALNGKKVEASREGDKDKKSSRSAQSTSSSFFDNIGSSLRNDSPAGSTSGSGSPHTNERRARESLKLNSATSNSLIQLPTTGIASSRDSDQGSPSIAAASGGVISAAAYSQLNDPPSQNHVPKQMSIPLRGRSQSSFSTFDIRATVTRRKGSADDIVTDVPSSFLAPPANENNLASATGPAATAHTTLMDPKEVVKKGRLFKLGISKKLGSDKTPVWKQRDFVLSGYYLSYLDSMKRRNEFDLRGCTVTSLIVHKSPGLSIDLFAMTINTSTNSRHIVLGGSSEEHRDEWVACIEKQLERINRLEMENGGEVEEARYKGIPSPLEQILLNPPLPSMSTIGNRKRLASASNAVDAKGASVRK